MFAPPTAKTSGIGDRDQGDVPLIRRDLLIVTLLSSLGLWAAVISFASTVPR
jgi:hypothetical protein